MKPRPSQRILAFLLALAFTLPADAHALRQEPPAEVPSTQSGLEESLTSNPRRQLTRPLITVPALGRQLIHTPDILPPNDPSTEMCLWFIQQNPHLFAGKRVLEIGCGAGPLTIALARAGAFVVALDILPEAVTDTLENVAGEEPEVQARVQHIGQSDVYEKLREITGEESPVFDVIFSAHPFIGRTPKSKADFASDAGRQFEMPRKILDGLPACLKRDGSYFSTAELGRTDALSADSGVRKWTPEVLNSYLPAGYTARSVAVNRETAMGIFETSAAAAGLEEAERWQAGLMRAARQWEKAGLVLSAKKFSAPFLKAELRVTGKIRPDDRRGPKTLEARQEMLEAFSRLAQALSGSPAARPWALEKIAADGPFQRAWVISREETGSLAAIITFRTKDTTPLIRILFFRIDPAGKKRLIGRMRLGADTQRSLRVPLLHLDMEDSQRSGPWVHYFGLNRAFTRDPDPSSQLAAFADFQQGVLAAVRGLPPAAGLEEVDDVQEEYFRDLESGIRSIQLQMAGDKNPKLDTVLRLLHAAKEARLPPAAHPVFDELLKAAERQSPSGTFVWNTAYSALEQAAWRREEAADVVRRHLARFKEKFLKKTPYASSFSNTLQTFVPLRERFLSGDASASEAALLRHLFTPLHPNLLPAPPEGVLVAGEPYHRGAPLRRLSQFSGEEWDSRVRMLLREIRADRASANMALRLLGSLRASVESALEAAADGTTSAFLPSAAALLEMDLQILRGATGREDPTLPSNALANAAVFPHLMAVDKRVGESPDPLWAAVQTACLGCDVDFHSDVVREGRGDSPLPAGSFDGFLGKTPRSFSPAYHLLSQRVNPEQNPRKILYMLDKPGEAGLDMVLVKHLVAWGHTVVLAARPQPGWDGISAEETRGLLRESGVNELFSGGRIPEPFLLPNPGEWRRRVEVVETGSSASAADLCWASPEFAQAWLEADVRIVKGPLAREILSGNLLTRDIFFLSYDANERAADLAYQPAAGLEEGTLAEENPVAVALRRLGMSQAEFGQAVGAAGYNGGEPVKQSAVSNWKLGKSAPPEALALIPRLYEQYGPGRLRRAREELGLTPEELAKVLAHLDAQFQKVGPVIIEEWESGNPPPPMAALDLIPQLRKTTAALRLGKSRSSRYHDPKKVAKQLADSLIRRGARHIKRFLDPKTGVVTLGPADAARLLGNSPTDVALRRGLADKVNAALPAVLRPGLALPPGIGPVREIRIVNSRVVDTTPWDDARLRRVLGRARELGLSLRPVDQDGRQADTPAGRELKNAYAQVVRTDKFPEYGRQWPACLQAHGIPPDTVYQKGGGRGRGTFSAYVDLERDEKGLPVPDPKKRVADLKLSRLKSLLKKPRVRKAKTLFLLGVNSWSDEKRGVCFGHNGGALHTGIPADSFDPEAPVKLAVEVAVANPDKTAQEARRMDTGQVVYPHEGQTLIYLEPPTLDGNPNPKAFLFRATSDISPKLWKELARLSPRGVYFVRLQTRARTEKGAPRDWVHFTVAGKTYATSLPYSDEEAPLLTVKVDPVRRVPLQAWVMGTERQVFPHNRTPQHGPYRVLVDPARDANGLAAPGSAAHERVVADPNWTRLWPELPLSKAKTVVIQDLASLDASSGSRQVFAFQNEQFSTSIPLGNGAVALEIDLLADDPERRPQQVRRMDTGEVVYPAPGQKRIRTDPRVIDNRAEGGLLHKAAYQFSRRAVHAALKRAREAVVFEEIPTFNNNGSVCFRDPVNNRWRKTSLASPGPRVTAVAYHKNGNRDGKNGWETYRASGPDSTEVYSNGRTIPGAAEPPKPDPLQPLTASEKILSRVVGLTGDQDFAAEFVAAASGRIEASGTVPSDPDAALLDLTGPALTEADFKAKKEDRTAHLRKTMAGWRAADFAGAPLPEPGNGTHSWEVYREKALADLMEIARSVLSSSLLFNIRKQDILTAFETYLWAVENSYPETERRLRMIRQFGETLRNSRRAHGNAPEIVRIAAEAAQRISPSASRTAAGLEEGGAKRSPLYHDPAEVAELLLQALAASDALPVEASGGILTLTYPRASELLGGRPTRTTFAKNTILVEKINAALRAAFLDAAKTPAAQAARALQERHGVTEIQVIPTPRAAPMRFSREEVLDLIGQAKTAGLGLSPSAIDSKEQGSTPLGKRLQRAYSGVVREKNVPGLAGWPDALTAAGENAPEIYKSKPYAERTGDREVREVTAVANPVFNEQGSLVSHGEVLGRWQQAQQTVVWDSPTVAAARTVGFVGVGVTTGEKIGVVFSFGNRLYSTGIPSIDPAHPPTLVVVASPRDPLHAPQFARARETGEQVYPAQNQVRVYLASPAENGLLPEGTFLFRAVGKLRPELWAEILALGAKSATLENLGTQENRGVAEFRLNNAHHRTTRRFDPAHPLRLRVEVDPQTLQPLAAYDMADSEVVYPRPPGFILPSLTEQETAATTSKEAQRLYQLLLNRRADADARADAAVFLIRHGRRFNCAPTFEQTLQLLHDYHKEVFGPSTKNEFEALLHPIAHQLRPGDRPDAARRLWESIYPTLKRAELLPADEVAAAFEQGGDFFQQEMPPMALPHSDGTWTPGSDPWQRDLPLLRARFQAAVATVPITKERESAQDLFSHLLLVAESSFPDIDRRRNWVSQTIEEVARAVRRSRDPSVPLQTAIARYSHSAGLEERGIMVKDRVLDPARVPSAPRGQSRVQIAAHGSLLGQLQRGFQALPQIEWTQIPADPGEAAEMLRRFHADEDIREQRDTWRIAVVDPMLFSQEAVSASLPAEHAPVFLMDAATAALFTPAVAAELLDLRLEPDGLYVLELRQGDRGELFLSIYA